MRSIKVTFLSIIYLTDIFTILQISHFIFHHNECREKHRRNGSLTEGSSVDTHVWYYDVLGLQVRGCLRRPKGVTTSFTDGGHKTIRLCYTGYEKYFKVRFCSRKKTVLDWSFVKCSLRFFILNFKIGEYCVPLIL